MNTPLAPFGALLLIALLGGCTGVATGTPPDASTFDAGGGDAGNSTTDAGRDSGMAGTDGGPADSGSADAGRADAGSDAGSCIGALLCDDFESYPAGAAPKGPWSSNTNSGSTTVDITRAHSGTQSVHISTLGANAYEQAYISVSGAPIFPVDGGVVYGRMMVWLTAAPTQTTHWSNIQGEGQVPGQAFSAFVRYGGQYSPKMMANYDTSGVASDCWHHSTTGIPTQRWACFEWRYDTPNSQMDFWLDGAQVTDLTVMGLSEPVGSDGCINNGTGGKWPLPVWRTLRLGWEHYQASDPIDMWIDDVGMDVQRIGCPR
jgi:hypothetical protein